jgi:nucleoside-diphosphate-sugar epimerase
MIDLSGRTVLVIGGAGYIGSVLAERLLACGAAVRVLDCLTHGTHGTLNHLLDDTRLEFVRGDFRNEEVVAAASRGAADVVLLASLVGDPICRKHPELALEINQHATTRLVDRLDDLGIRRFVFVSTCSNYGLRNPEDAAAETDDLNPQSLYATTKVHVERHVVAASQASRCTPVVLRFATAYGISPRMRFDLTVSQFALQLARGQPLTVYDADTWRPYCHVRDLSAAIVSALVADEPLVRGEVYNVGSDSQQFTKRMIVDEILQHVPGAEVRYVEGDTDPRNYRVAFGKIRDRLGFVCHSTVQRYAPALVDAIRNGVFPDAPSTERYGNYRVELFS